MGKAQAFQVKVIDTTVVHRELRGASNTEKKSNTLELCSPNLLSRESLVLLAY